MAFRIDGGQNCRYEPRTLTSRVGQRSWQDCAVLHTSQGGGYLYVARGCRESGVSETEGVKSGEVAIDLDDGKSSGAGAKPNGGSEEW